MSTPQHDGQLSAAYEELLEERNRLWEELQECRSMEEEAVYWRQRAQDIEGSRWWRAGMPFRVAKRLKSDPAGTLSDIAHDLHFGRRDR
jgi:hypothetical protein